MSTEKQKYADSKLMINIPKMYHVVFHNDDYTPMNYVVDILIIIFKKGNKEAYDIMMKVHKSESCIVDTYTYDIAMTKKIQADLISKENSYPLKITVEEAI